MPAQNRRLTPALGANHTGNCFPKAHWISNPSASGSLEGRGSDSIFVHGSASRASVAPATSTHVIGGP